MQRTTAPIGGLMIGQTVTDPDGGFRVVVIDPDLNTVEAGDSAGALLFETIDHFIASHTPIRSAPPAATGWAGASWCASRL